MTADNRPTLPPRAGGFLQKSRRADINFIALSRLSPNCIVKLLFFFCTAMHGSVSDVMDLEDMFLLVYLSTTSH